VRPFPLFSRPLGGIWFTLASIAGVELVTERLFVVPQPSSLYGLTVAAATTLGGTRIGLISALMVIIVSLLRVSDPGMPFHFRPELTVRLALYCVTTPLMALVVGWLRGHNERLALERTERAVAEERAVTALTRERRIVDVLQGMLLTPPEPTAFPGLLVGTRYEAASDEAEIGGDFFDTFTFTVGNAGTARQKVALLIGDVSGKGLAAASRTAEVKYTVRAMLREFGRDGIAVALSRANHALAVEAEEGKGGSPQMSGFTCLALAAVDPATGETEIVVAGMEPPIIVRAANGRAEQLRLEGLPLGISAEAGYQALCLSLVSGDMLLFTTDGITEARDASGTRYFGATELPGAAERAAKLPSLDQTTLALLNAAKRFTPDGRLRDDACLLAVRRC